MLKDIKAVIFDLDGTLVDSMWMWKKIDIEYLGGCRFRTGCRRKSRDLVFRKRQLILRRGFRYRIPLIRLKHSGI